MINKSVSKVRSFLSNSWSSNSWSSSSVDLLSGGGIVSLLPDTWSTSDITWLLISCRNITIISLSGSIFPLDRLISGCVNSLTSNNWIVDVLPSSGVLSSSGVLGLSSSVLSLSSLDVLSLSCSICSLELTAVEFNFKRLFRIVNDLSFNGNVLVLLDFSFSGDILNGLLGDVLRDVLSQILNGIIVRFSHLSWDSLDSLLFSVFSHFPGFWDSLNSHFILILDDLFLEWDILDSALSLDHLFSSVNSCVNNLGSLHKSLVNTRTGITLIVSSGGISSLVDVSPSCVWICILIGWTVNLLVSTLPIKSRLATGLSISDRLTADKFSYESVNKSGLGHMIWYVMKLNYG